VFQKVLLAVDGSEHSGKAVSVAADIAKKSHGEVLAFHVREYQVARGGAYPLEEEPHAQELVDGITASLQAEGVKARGVVEPHVVDSVAGAILAEAEAEGADAIVMGCRGRSELAGLLLGSVAHKVIQLSHCPVVIAR
jgi:nucleotide-binding universal stress UspA family protein